MSQARGEQPSTAPEAGPVDRIASARWVPSPHQDARPQGLAIDLLVIHGISLPPGEFGGPWIERLFTGTLTGDGHPYLGQVAKQRVSAHLLIRRDGELLQFVDLSRRAWHAGPSQFDGRTACNDFSIGIELEGTDDIPYTDHQYRRLTGVTREIMARWPAITPRRIVGHCDIAPGRKTDPGPAFDWQHYRTLIAQDASH